ncbi:MAG TPA: NADH-quinone oxidoreductase subunit H [Gemmataceae bacterium]|nr:NADH-quinone oxidoreductase subunit H [Gemmataceae bacterium]
MNIMEVVLTILHVLIHFTVAATFPPLLLGIINKTKALFAGRVGPPLLQPYYDLLRLFQKGSVFSTTTSWVFRAGPVVGLAAVAMALLFVPLGHHAAPLSFTGDLILLAYLLGLARFVTAAAALDTGSPFEGMGAAREVTFGCLAEPALFFGLLVMAKLSKSLQVSTMLGDAVEADWQVAAAPLVLVAASWFIVMLVENCRIPFDDPNTHLELTMVHEVMVLDHSGPALGMILYTAALKLFLFGALIVRIAVPVSTVNGFADWPLFLAAMAVLAVVIGVVESVLARLRLVAIPQLLVAAGLLAAFGMVLLTK